MKRLVNFCEWFRGLNQNYNLEQLLRARNHIGHFLNYMPNGKLVSKANVQLKTCLVCC